MAQAMVDAFGRLFIFGDATYSITQKVAFIILCAALITQGWRGRAVQDVTLWIWALLGLLFATVTIAQWLNITRPPDGAAWQLGQSLAKAIGDADTNSMKSYLDQVQKDAPEVSWVNLTQNMKNFTVEALIYTSLAVVFFMRILQMAMIAILYSLGPLFISFICIGVLRHSGIRYLFTLASMYTWDLAWKFVDAGSEALMAFGSSTGQGYNPLMLPLALLWAIVAPIFMPIFLSRLFVSGASGLAEAAQGFAMGRMNAAGNALANKSSGSLASVGKAAMAPVALATAGVGTVASLAQSAFGGLGKMMSTARQATTGSTNNTQQPSSATEPSSSSSGPLQNGQSREIAGVTIKRNNGSFSIGKHGFYGDPNNAQILNDALKQTDLDPTAQALVRHTMRQQQGQPA